MNQRKFPLDFQANVSNIWEDIVSGYITRSDFNFKEYIIGLARKLFYLKRKQFKIFFLISWPNILTVNLFKIPHINTNTHTHRL